MAVEQFYYTSWANKAPGGQAGFQVRGVSPGLGPDDQRLLTDLIAYRIPPRLDARALATHPIALRYKHLGPRKAVLLCCQSNGTDEMGRYGNFFAHALVLAPDQFTHVPPILYWRSPFWRTSDESPGTSIPALARFDVEPSLDVARVWGFLAEGPRSQWLYKLMCAVIHGQRTHRRVVIVDAPDNVALWIAAVSIMLPSLYRPLLSFATYHNDPYRSDFLITGTLADSDFQASTADFMSFFVLQPATGRISEVDDSPYARMAADVARPGAYEERMLDFLLLCDRHFRPDQRIDERLDLAALYERMVSAQRPGALGPDQLQATSLVLGGLEGPQAVRGDDLDDLAHLVPVLAAAVHAQPTVEAIQEYGRALRLLLAAAPAAALERLPGSIAMAGQMLLGGQAEAGQALWRMLHQIYGDTAVMQGLNAPASLRALAGQAEAAQPAALAAVWRQFGADLVPGPDSQDVLVASLKCAARGGEIAADGRAVIQAAAEAARRAGPGPWLTLAVGQADRIPSAALDAYYYALVADLSLDERVRYRDLILPRRGDIPRYEIRADLERESDADGSMAVLERWARHAQSGARAIPGWMDQALATIQQRTPRGQMATQAARILLSPTLQPYVSPQWEATLLGAALGAVSLARPTELDLRLCQRYRDNRALSAEDQALMEGVLAMSSGQLDRQSAMRLHRRFAQLSPEQYAAEAHEFIVRFFHPQVTRASHASMVLATYSLPRHHDFWDIYGRTFVATLAAPHMAQIAVELLGFWFDDSPRELGDSRYIVPSFFLQLPALFEVAQKEKGYRDTAREIDRLAQGQPWYALVQYLVTPERRGFLGVFRG